MSQMSLLTFQMSRSKFKVIVAVLEIFAKFAIRQSNFGINYDFRQNLRWRQGEGLHSLSALSIYTCYQVQVVRCRQGHLTFVGEELLVKETLRLYTEVGLIVIINKIPLLTFHTLISCGLTKIYCISC